jgi:hypothetical protein
VTVPQSRQSPMTGLRAILDLYCIY